MKGVEAVAISIHQPSAVSSAQTDRQTHPNADLLLTEEQGDDHINPSIICSRHLRTDESPHKLIVR